MFFGKCHPCKNKTCLHKIQGYDYVKENHLAVAVSAALGMADAIWYQDLYGVYDIVGPFYYFGVRAKF